MAGTHQGAAWVEQRQIHRGSSVCLGPESRNGLLFLLCATLIRGLKLTKTQAHLISSKISLRAADIEDQVIEAIKAFSDKTQVHVQKLRGFFSWCMQMRIRLLSFTNKFPLLEASLQHTLSDWW